MNRQPPVSTRNITHFPFRFMGAEINYLRITLSAILLLIPASCSGAPASLSPADPRSPLILELRIPLPNVRGRIDHLAVDPAGRRLFVAEVANGSVDEVDVARGQHARRIVGLRKPQGLAYLAPLDELVAACGDGSVRFYDGHSLQLKAQIHLGGDADNIRIDPRTGHVVIGFGSGALAIIDPLAHRLIATLPLGSHPESFRLDDARAFVNLPDAGVIALADIDRKALLARWPTDGRRLNFPMALDPDAHVLAIAYRFPTRLELRDMSTGRVVLVRQTCGDADDLFFDRAAKAFYVICGSGGIDMASTGKDSKAVVIISARGARTGLLVPEWGRLFVAAPSRNGMAASILVFRRAH